MNSLPYGSLSPTLTFYRWPNSTELTSEVAPCVSVPEAKAELPVYDDISDLGIHRKILSAQQAVENLVNRDTSKRERRSLWLRPKRVISLPYGVHEILQVEQQTSSGAFSNITNYEVIGLGYLEVELEALYPTRIRYNSGADHVDPILKEAVLQETSYYFKNRNDPNEQSPEIINGVSAITMNLLSNYIR